MNEGIQLIMFLKEIKAGSSANTGTNVSTNKDNEFHYFLYADDGELLGLSQNCLTSFGMKSNLCHDNVDNSYKNINLKTLCTD